MPVIMLTSVDLPLPDLPTTLTNSPAVEIGGDVLQRREIAGRGLEDLGDLLHAMNAVDQSCC